MSNFENRKKKTLIELENRYKKNMDNYKHQLEVHDSTLNVNEKNMKYNLLINSREYRIKSKEEFIFSDISNKSIISKGQEIVYDANLTYNKFYNCIFKGIIFSNCNFYGSIFSECIFENIIFDNCTFYTDNNLITIFKEQCNLIKCTFKNCNMEKFILNECHINNTKFILTKLKNAIFNKIEIKNISLADCDMRCFKIISSKIESLSFEDEYLTKFDDESFIDEIIIENNKNNFENVYKIYKDIATKYEANRLPNRAGDYYYLYKRIERKTLKGIDKLKSYIFWMLCGYGEKPTYALITSVEIVLIFTLIYMFTGLSIGMDIIDYDILIFKDLPIDGLILDFLKSLYFSIVTFTTVGYGDITPIGYSVFLSGIEMFLGVTMVGIWTATLARKITR